MKQNFGWGYVFFLLSGLKMFETKIFKHADVEIACSYINLCKLNLEKGICVSISQNWWAWFLSITAGNVGT